MKVISLIITSIFLALIPEVLVAQQLVDESIQIGNATTIELSHEYASVNIKTWDKNTVQVIAHLDISDDRTDIFNLNLEKQGKTIILNTSIDADIIRELCKENKYPAQTKDDKGENTKISCNVICGFQVNIKIDVYIPKTLDIDLKSVYGTTKLFDISQKVNVFNEYAEIDVIFDKVVAGSSVHSTYANVDVFIPTTESVRIDASTDFGKIFSDIDDYTVNTSSEFDFGQNGSLKIGTATKNLQIESNYQNIYIRSKKKLKRLTN